MFVVTVDLTPPLVINIMYVRYAGMAVALGDEQHVRYAGMAVALGCSR